MRSEKGNLTAVILILAIVLLLGVLGLLLLEQTKHPTFSKEEGQRNLTLPAGYPLNPGGGPLTSQPANVYWIADLVEKVLPSVVHVQTERVEKHPGILKQFKKEKETIPSPFKDFFDDDFQFFFGIPDVEQEIPVSGVGSGFIISEDGYIVTNAHVVKGATSIKVTLHDHSQYTAKLVGLDVPMDIAVLKINAKGLPSARLGDSSKLRIGEPAIAIGSPFGLESTVTAGIISAIARDPREVGAPDASSQAIGTRIRKFIQTDAAINRGNSGGPLINARGEVIGVNQAIIAYAGKIGFAIPINDVKGSIDQLIKKGKVVYPGIGVLVQDVTDEVIKQFKLEVDSGALVAQVNAGAPADKAGIEPGDVILQVGQVKIRNSNDLVEEIQRHSVGDKVTLLVAKGGKKSRQVKVVVVLEELKFEDAEAESE